MSRARSESCDLPPRPRLTRHMSPLVVRGQNQRPGKSTSVDDIDEVDEWSQADPKPCPKPLRRLRQPSPSPVARIDRDDEIQGFMGRSNVSPTRGSFSRGQRQRPGRAASADEVDEWAARNVVLNIGAVHDRSEHHPDLFYPPQEPAAREHDNSEEVDAAAKHVQAGIRGAEVRKKSGLSSFRLVLLSAAFLRPHTRTAFLRPHAHTVTYSHNTMTSASLRC